MNRSVKTMIAGAAAVAILLTVAGAQAAPARCTPLTLASRSLAAASNGTAYLETVQVFGGVPPVSVMLAAGLLPPGIRLSSSGELAGTPTASGNYEFTVTAVDSCKPTGQSATAVLSVFVNRQGETAPGPENSVVRKAPLKVTTETVPNKVMITAGQDTKATIRYKLTAQPAETATMDSPGASFSVDGSVAESIAAPLTAVLVNGSGEVEETVKISKRALDMAAREKATKITYSRAFIGRRTTTIGVVEFTLVK